MIINVLNLILTPMQGAEPMLKRAQRNVPIAKPRGEPIDIDRGYERVIARFSRIMARLGR